MPTDISDLQISTVQRLLPRLGDRRSLGAPIRRTFVRADPEGTSPLSTLISSSNSRGGGGRGGRTRLALLISLYWVCAGDDFSTERPARWWAELLGLPDAARRGQDIITSNLHELSKRNLIKVEHPRPGHPPKITVLREEGSGREYTIPGGGPSDSYFRVPEALWRSGLITKLKGPGLVVYLILNSVRTGGPDQQFFFPRERFEALFAISDLTRRRGFKELVEHDVLTREDISTDATGGRAGRLSPRAVYQFTQRGA